MTRRPITVAESATLDEAHRLMQQHSIRHLPVVDKHGRLVGVVSDHDIELVELFEGGDPETTNVDEAMSDRVRAVREDTPLDEVAELMAKRRCDSVVATSDRGIEGIFTAVDACEALVDVLRRVTC